MKKQIPFEEIAQKNNNRFNRVLPYVASSRKPRSKPRSVDESEGISIATMELVQQAIKSGKLKRKLPKGFILK